MNPETTLANDQIFKIFRHHKLARNPKIDRINIGFTNEVHQVDNYILKLYLRKDGEQNYAREAKLYKQLEGKALTPKLILADGSKKLVDKPYIIYRAIEGEALGFHWHELSDQQRREIVKTLCAQIRIIAELDPEPRLARSWQTHVKAGISERLAAVEQKKLLPASLVAEIREFIKLNLFTLEKEVMGFIYWDVHLDNIIVNRGRMVGLIDFEHVDPVSIDYLLNNVQRMVKYPKRTVVKEMEPYAKKKDYIHMMAWFREFYPELFDFPDLQKRLGLYELDEVLRLLPRFKTANSGQRIQKILKS